MTTNQERNKRINFINTLYIGKKSFRNKLPVFKTRGYTVGQLHCFTIKDKLKCFK